MGSSVSYTYIWNGQASSDWNDPTNWTPNGVPGDGDTVYISPTGVAAVLNGKTVTLSNAVVTNDGQIQLNSIGEYNDTALIVNGAVTLEGAGAVVMSDVGSYRTNEIYSTVANSTLDNQQTIEGAGAIYGNGDLTLNNDATGVIDADGATPLAIHDITVNNDNLLESTQGALSIYNATINNAGAGEFLADGAGTQVDINNTTVYGGTFTTLQGGVVAATSGSSDNFDGSTADGPIVISAGSVLSVNNGATLNIEGTIENSGQIQLNSIGEYNDTALIVNGAVTLEGAGAVVMSDVGSYRTNEIYSTVANSTLDNQQTIEGAGAIYGNGDLTLNNDATGVIDADGATPLAIHDITVNNDNLLESTQGALSIYNATINNAGAGEFLADGAGTQVDINNTTVYGGTYTTLQGGVIAATSGSSDNFDGSTADGPIVISAGSVLSVNNDATLNIEGTIENSGQIQLNSVGEYNDTALIANGLVTLEGLGAIVMADAGNSNRTNEIYSNVAGSTLNNQQTIEGSGAIYSNGNLTLDNNPTGVIDANVADTLAVHDITVNNENLLESTQGALSIFNATINNTGAGEILANGAGTQVDINNTTVNGGPLTTENGGVINATSGSADNFDDVTITLGSIVSVNRTAVLDLTGTIENDGQIQLNATGEYDDTDLVINGTVTLSGSGAIVMSDAGTWYRTNRIYGAASSELDNQQTIEGSGEIFGYGNLTLLNDISGVIDVDVASPLSIHDITVNNDNLLESTLGALLLTNATVNNTGVGRIVADGANTAVDINSSTINAGTLTTDNGGVINVTSGGSDTFNGAGAPIVITAGTVVSVNRTAVLYLEGTIENAGQIQLNATGEYDDTDVIISGAVTLEGAGAVVLSDAGTWFRTNRIYSNVSGSTLDNQQTIEGSGEIFSNGSLTLNNDTTGAIDANAADPLSIHDIIVNNKNLLESTAGELYIFNATVNNFGAGEILAAGAGADVAVNNTTINGGALATTGGGVINVTAGSSDTFDDVIITAGSVVSVNRTAVLNLTGTIENDGQLQLNATGEYDDTGLIIDGAVTLKGAGAIVMSNAGTWSRTNRIYSNAAGSSLDNQETIEGSGEILGSGNLTFLNDASGVVDANTGSPLNIHDVAFTNEGVLRAENGASLLVNNALTNISADPNYSTGSVLTGGTYDVIDPVNGGAGSGGASTIAIAGNGALQITTLDATVDLTGATSLLTSNGVSLAASLRDVGAAGALNLYYGYNSQSQQAFTAANPLTVDGAVTLNGAVMNAALTIDASGVLTGVGESDGATPENAEVNGAIVNDGTVVGGSAGYVSPAGAPESLFVVNGAVSGDGAIDIQGNSIVELKGVSGAGQTVNFENTETSALATLRIDATSVNPTGDFASAIAGFRGGDAIDLANFSGEQSYSYDPGTDELSVVFTTGGTAELGVSGLGASPALTFSTDGGAGTLITSAMTAVLADDTSNGKAVTSDPALTGTGAPGATITVSEGGNPLGTTTVGGNGGWSFTPTGLTDGSQTLVADETIGGQPVSSAAVAFTLEQRLSEEAGLSVVVDNGATAPIGAAEAGATPVSVSGLYPDDNGTLTFSDGNPADNQTLAIVDGALAQSAVNLSLMQDGPITSTLSVTDTANNSFTKAGNTVTLDQGELQTWSAAAQFSATANPNAPWSYAYNNGSGEPLLTVTGQGNSTGLTPEWDNGASAPNWAAVGVNLSSNPYVIETVYDPPGYLRMDPQGNKSVDVLFAAPTAGTYSITGSFEGVDTGEQSHTVAVEVGGVAVWSAIIASYGQLQSFSLTEILSAGETVDFASDTGASYNNLSTGLATVITTNKEQSQLSLTVDGGSATPLGQAAAGAVSFTVGGLESVDAGVVTFTDSKGGAVSVAINGAQSSYSVDLATLADGPITSSLAVTSGAGAAFAPVAGNTITLDQALGEQAALALSVDNGAATPIGAAGAGHVAFTIAGLQPGDHGVVTFTDADGHTVALAVTGASTGYTVNLSALTDGAVTSSLAVASDAAGNSFTPVAGNTVTLAQDLGEQAALALSVDGGSSTPIGAAAASVVSFTIAGLLAGDTGVVTFTDAEGHQVQVAVTSAQTSYSADLAGLADGTVTATLALATDAAGNSFAPVAGNAVTLAQDLSEQAALALSVDGGATGAQITASNAAATPFSIAGLQPGDAGVVTFTDANGKSVKVAVAYGQNNYTANLSSLALGAVTDSLSVGGYDFVNFTKTNTIQTGLIAQFPTGLFEANDGFATPFDITADANGHNYNDAGGTLTINVGLNDVTNVYTLMNAYSPPDGAEIATVEFIGSGGAEETFTLVNGQQVRDYYQGVYANSINGTTTQNAFSIDNVTGSGGTGNVNTGDYGDYVVDEQDFALNAAFANQTLEQIVITQQPNAGTPILLGVTAQTGTDAAGNSFAPVAGNTVDTVANPPQAKPQTIYTAVTWGDVHIVSFDGLAYNFQAAGEFIAAQSTVAGDSYEVEVRTAPYGNGASVSVMTEIAAEVGADRVTFGLNRNDVVWVDGVGETLTTGDAVEIGNGAGTLEQTSSNSYQITWSTGEALNVTDSGAYFNLSTTLAPGAAAGSVKGLLGELDGQASDFQLADGTVIPQPLANSELYGPYANAWRIPTGTQGLFDYGANQTTDNYTDLNFPSDAVSLGSLPQSVLDAAAAQVAAAGITDPGLSLDAELDLIVTGNLDALGASQNAQQSGVTTTQAQFTGSLTPPPTAGVSANATSVTEDASGTTALTFTAYLTSAATTDTKIAWSVVAPAGGDIGYTGASLAALGGSLPSGVVTIAAGQTTATFTVDVPNAALGAAPSGSLNVLIGAPNNVPVFAPEAQTTLVNDQPEPGNAAAPAVYEVSGGGTLSQSGGVYTLNLGDVVQGEGALVQLGLTNAALAPADSLGGSVSDTGTGGFSVAGDGALADALAPGQTYQGLHVTVGTTNLGPQSDTLTFDPIDENQSGYSADLSPVTVVVEDNVLAPAAAVVDPGSAQPVSVNLGAIRVGPAPSGAASVALTVENAAASGAAALDASIAGTSTGVTASGAINQLAAGDSSQALSVGLDSSTGGVKYGSVSLSFASDAGNGNVASLPGQSVTVSGTVYREATVSIAPASSIIHVGDPTTEALVVANTGVANGYSEGALVTGETVTGQSNFSAVSGATGEVLAGASSKALQLQLGSTATAGVYSGEVTVGLETDGGAVATGSGGTNSDGFGVTDLGAVSAPLTVTIDNYASATIEKTSGAGTLTSNGGAYTLDLGDYLEGTGYVETGFGVLNQAPTNAPADWLSGTFSVSGNTTGAFTQGSLAEFTNLSAGQSDSAPQVALSTAEAGDFSETVTLNPTDSNVAGYSEALSPDTLTIVGKVIPLNISAAPVTVDQGADGGTTTVALNVVNLEAAGGDNLQVKIVGLSGAIVSASGQTTVAAGATDSASLTATFSTATAGNLTGDVEVDVSDNGTDLGTVSVPIAATVDNPAVAEMVDNGQSGSVTPPAGLQLAAGGYTLDLGTTYQGSAPLIADLAALNGAASPSDALNGTFTGPTGAPEYANGGFGSFSGYSAGQQTGTDVVELTTYKVGTFTETFTLNPTETNSGGQIVTLPAETVTVTGTIAPPPPAPPPVAPTAAAWGDVHITTFQGLMYNFQAEGEFTLAKSTVAGDSYNVQIRLSPWSPGASVSVITQVAAGVGAGQVNFSAGDSTVMIDGHAADFSSSSTISLGGGAGSVTELSSNAFRVNWATGEVLDVTNDGSYISLSTTLGSGDGAGSVEGLLGANTSQATDFQLPDGTLLSQPLSLSELYTEFADAWRVTDATSLMDYPNNEGTANFTDTSFPADYNELANVPANILAQAKTLAEQAGITDPGLLQAAELDYIVTGDPNAITQSQNAQQQGVTTTQADIAAAPPSIQLGVSANATSVVELASGPTPITFTAYLTEAATADTTVNWQAVAADATDLGASALGGSLPSGTVTIAAGASSATFTVEVPEGALGTTASANLQVEVTGDSNNDTIFAPTAETAIVNASPIAGPQAQPQFAELSGGGVLSQNGDAYTLSVGSVAQGALESLQLAILNAAAQGGDNLTGEISDSGVGGSTVTGDGGLPLIAAGSSYGGLRVDLGTTATGAQSETIVFKPTDANATGYSAPLATETLTIDYTVAPTVAVAIAPTDLTGANDTATVDFSFSSAPVNFSLADVTAADGALSNLSGAGTSYSATFTAATGVDTNDATIAVTAGSWTDASGVAGEGGVSSAFSIDTPPPYYTVTQYIADKTALDAGPAFTIEDSAAEVASNFAALVGDAKIQAITLTDSGTPTLTLTIEDALEGASTLAKITTPYQVAITDTASDIAALTSAEAQTLKSDGYTTLNAQGPVTLTVATATSLAADGLTIAGATTTVSDTAAALKTLTAAGIAGLAKLGVGELIATDADVALSTAQRAALGTAGILLQEPFVTGTVQTVEFYASGVTQEVNDYGYKNQPYTTVEIAYSQSGAITSKTWLRSDGTTYQTETWNGDGSYSLYNTAGGTAWGAPYASYDLNYNAVGKPVSETWSNGAAESWSYDSITGALLSTVVTGIVNPSYDEIDTSYGPNGKPASETFSNGETGTWTYNPDGSYQIAYASVPGQAYTSYTVQYGSNGKPTSEAFSNGETATWTYNPDGSYQIAYASVPGQAYTSYTVQYGANGKPTSEAFSNGETAAWTYNSDGSYQIAYASVPGQAYTSYTVQYGSNGKSTSATYSNGETESWTYSPAGALESIAFAGITGAAYTTYTVEYGANGAPASATYSNGQTETWTYNGGVLESIAYAGVTGAPYTSYTVLYGANGQPASATYSNGQTETWTYSGGVLASIAYAGVTGAPYTSYTVLYGANGKPASATYSNGQTETWTYNPNGLLENIAYAGITGAAYTSYTVQYSANSEPASATFSNGQTETWTYNPTGVLESIAYAGITGAAYTTDTVQYGANGEPASATFSNGQTETWSYNANGVLESIAYAGITGAAYTFYTVQYGANGEPASATFSNGETESWTYHTDGSYQTAYASVPGQAYTSYTVQYGSNGKPTSEALGNGETVTWTYNTDGSYQIAYASVPGQAYVSYTIQYGANGKRTSEKWLTSGGATYQTETWNSDGSYILYNAAGGTAWGAAYASYDLNYNASGKPVSETWSNGAAESWSYDANTGALLSTKVTGITNPNYVEADTNYGSSGKPALETWLLSNGTTYQTETWNSDGSYSLYNTAGGTAWGAPFTSLDLNYNASGKPVSETWSNGAAEIWTYNKTGALTEVLVAGITNPNYVATNIFYGANGKPSSEIWLGPSGLYMSEAWSYASDGGYQAVTTEPAGSAYALIADIYSAASLHIAEARDAAVGQSALQLFASGVQASQGASVLSVEYGADTFALNAETNLAITATNSNTDTFDLSSGFGQTSIAGFQAAGSTADILNLKLSMFNASWFTGDTTEAAEAISLLSHATGASSTTLTDSAGDTLTLLGVTKSTLQSNISDIKLS